MGLVNFKPSAVAELCQVQVGAVSKSYCHVSSIKKDRKRLALSPTSIRNHAVRFERGLITSGNFRILVLVRNHPSALLYSSKHIVVRFLMGDFKTERIEPTTIAHGQMACRFPADIEVLVKPISGRAINAAFAPFDLDDFILVPFFVRVNALLLVLKQDVTDGLQSHDNGARPMIVSLVIFADGPLAQMTDQSIARHLELAQTQTSAFDLEVFQKRV